MLELKSTTAKMKNSLEGFNSRFEQAEEINSKPKDRTTEIIQYLRNREKKENEEK